MIPESKVAIVGYGRLGKALHGIFPTACLYDKPKRIGSETEVSDCEITFVAVPTPRCDDGQCDTSMVEEVVGWIDSDLIVLVSTVAVGTTERLRNATGKRLVFQPEYGPGDTPEHPYRNLRDIPWVVLGGERRDTMVVSDLYKRYFSSEISIWHTTSSLAELSKYMTNAFLAMKVAFCNEFYDIARRASIDYDELREIWLLDQRIGRTHTFVMPEDRGFGGNCLPKDLEAILATSINRFKYQPLLLEAILKSNARARATGRQPEPRANPFIER